MHSAFIDGHHPEPITSETPLDHLMAMEEQIDDDETPDASELKDIPLNALGVLLRYLIPPAGSAARWPKALKRMICLAHAAGIDGVADRSLASIAAEIGCSRASLSHWAIRMADELGQEQVRGGKSRAARKAYSRSATATHKRLGHNMSNVE